MKFGRDNVQSSQSVSLSRNGSAAAFNGANRILSAAAMEESKALPSPVTVDRAAAMAVMEYSQESTTTTEEQLPKPTPEV
jgi:hypothetical protein